MKFLKHTLIFCIAVLITGCSYDKSTGSIVSHAESARRPVSLSSDADLKEPEDNDIPDDKICTDIRAYDGQWHKYISELDNSDFGFSFEIDMTAYHGNSYIIRGKNSDVGYLCKVTQIHDDASQPHYGFDFLCVNFDSGFADRLLVIPPDNIGSQLADIIPAYFRDIYSSSVYEWTKAKCAADMISVFARVCEEPDALSAEMIIVDRLSDVRVEYSHVFGKEYGYDLPDAVNDFSLHITRKDNMLIFSAIDDFDKGYRLIMNDDDATCRIIIATNIVSGSTHDVIVDRDLEMSLGEFDEILSSMRIFFEAVVSSDAPLQDRSNAAAFVLSSVYSLYADPHDNDIVSIIGDENWDQDVDLNNDKMLSYNECRIRDVIELTDILISDLNQNLHGGENYAF